jgi:hypothetical protein
MQSEYCIDHTAFDSYMCTSLSAMLAMLRGLQHSRGIAARHEPYVLALCAQLKRTTTLISALSAI